jgi:hypothetical protein
MNIPRKTRDSFDDNRARNADPLSVDGRGGKMRIGVVRLLRLSRLAITLLSFGAGAYAYPGKHFDLRTLVEESEVIAVVDIPRIVDVGRTIISVDSHSLLSDTYKADVNTQRRIKGICPDRFVLIFFTPQSFVGYPGVGTGLQIVF